MKDYKFAAIDIGSNAVRLLLARVFENGEGPIFKKESLVRVPIRLGDDVFTGGSISERKKSHLIKTMSAYRLLIDAYEALDYSACATSAMREAGNGQKVIEDIKNESGLDINIIDGRREAEIIFEHHLDESPFKNHSALYIDVGGGSTEITVFNGRDSVCSGSFDIGTIRILENLVTSEQWKEMKMWLKDATAELVPEVAVGTGGNINKIFRLVRQKENRPIARSAIKSIKKMLTSLTFNERIRGLHLRPDRADVIVPATDIFISVMKWAGIKYIYVPQVGLSDGLIRIMYNTYRNEHQDALA